MADRLTSGPELQENLTPDRPEGQATTQPPSVRVHLLESAERLEKRAQQQSAVAGRIRALDAALDENPAVVPAFEAWAQDFFCDG